MRIVFNLHNVGLGNNGGSRTIIKCADTLSGLGQDVILFTNQKVKFSWGKIKTKILLGNTHPKCDISIATGFKSIDSTLKCQAKNKYCYIRGLERWVADEKILFKTYKKIKCIVNSEWLKDYFEKHKIESKIIYPGLDFNKFFNTNKSRLKDVGAIYSTRHKTKRHLDAEKLSTLMRSNFVFLNKNIINANEDKLREWYNNIKIWFSPSELEGLHNPPMEATLCGCALVCTNHYMSGVSDFARHGETAMIYPARDLKTAKKYIEDIIEDVELRSRLNKNMVDLLKKKIGTRKYNMQRLLEHIRSDR